MKKRFLLLVLITLTLTFLLSTTLLSALVVEQETYTGGTLSSPKPFFKIYFGEDPVTITDHCLLRDGEDLLCTDDQSLAHFEKYTPLPGDTLDLENRNFLFNTTSIVFDGKYVFFTNATDSDDNQKQILLTFEVKTDSPEVYFYPPSQNHITEPNFFMSTRENFNLSIHLYSSLPIDTCKYGFPQLNYLNYPDETHVFESLLTPLSKKQIPGTYYEYYFYNESFNASKYNIVEEDLTTLRIYCNYTGDAEHTIRGAELFIGYDTSPPVLSLEKDKEKVFDLNDRKTNFTVTIDDKTVCRVSNPHRYLDGALNDDLPPISPFGTSPQNRFTYDQEELFSFSFLLNPPLDAFRRDYPGPYNYSMNITCENMAGVESYRMENITIQYEQQIIITALQNYYFDTSSPTLEFQTNVLANCQVLVDRKILNNNNVPIASLNKKDHSFSIKDLTEGSHPYEISCNNNDYATVTGEGNIVYDIIKPNITLNPAEPIYLCGADTSFPFTATLSDLGGSGIEFLSYTFKEDRPLSKILLEESTPTSQLSRSINVASISDYTFDPTDETKFVLKFKGEDKAGNKATEKTLTVQHYADTNAFCDDVDPIVNATIQLSSNKTNYQVVFNCNDTKNDPSGTGCEANVHYYLTSINTPCAEDSQAVEYGEELVQKTGNPLNIYTKQRVCFYGTDKAKPYANEGFNYVDVEGNLGLRIVSPEHTASSTAPITITFTTDKESVCKYGRVSANTDVIFLFGTSQYTASSTDNLTHSFTVNFASAAKENYYIVCDVNDEDIYGRLLFPIRYDPTAPNIHVESNPYIIKEPNQNSANLLISSDDDVICSVLLSNQEPGVSGTQYVNFAQLGTTTTHVSSVNQESSYGKNYNLQLPYNQNLAFTNTLRTYNYEISCTNLAGVTTTTTYPLLVNKSDQISIDLLYPPIGQSYINTRNPNIQIQTYINSDCTFAIDDGTETSFGTGKVSNNYYLYSKATSLIGEGTYGLSVLCSSKDTTSVFGYLEPRPKLFSVDLTAPNLTITSGTSTISRCGEDTIFSFSASAEDLGSGVDYINYTLVKSNNVLLNGGTSSEELLRELDLNNIENFDNTKPASFTLNIFARDKVGNPKTLEKKTIAINYYPGKDAHCDSTPPTVSATTQLASTKRNYQVVFACADSDSGCKNTIYYYYADFTETCEQNASSTRYHQENPQIVGAPLNLYVNRKVCFYGEDKSLPKSNHGYGSIDVTGNLDINITSPQHAASQEATFTVYFTTSEESICRYGISEKTNPLRNDVIYLYGLNEHTATTQDGLEHNFTLSYPQGQTQNRDYYIVCNVTNKELFGLDIRTYLYDPSDPALSITSNPVLLKELNDKDAILTIKTAEDAVICSVLLPGEEPGQTVARYLNFIDPSITNEHIDYVANKILYKKEFTLRVPFVSTEEFSDAPYTYNYDITCTNLAGRTTTETYGLEVNKPNELVITLLYPTDSAYINTQKPTIRIETELESTCTYSMDTPVYNPFNTASSVTAEGNHLYTVTTPTLSEGLHELNIICISKQDENMRGFMEPSKTFTIDMNNPRVPIMNGDKATCSANSAEIYIASNDTFAGVQGSGISHIEYAYQCPWLGVDTIKRDNISSDGGATLTIEGIPTTGNEGQSCFIQTRAHDKSGRTSDWTNDYNLLITDESHVYCDKKNPTGIASYSATLSGANVALFCQDNEGGSGCKNTYWYTVVDETTDCPPTLTATKPLGTFIPLGENKKLCWEVQDLGENKDRGEVLAGQILRMSITEPRNGIAKTNIFNITLTTTQAADKCKFSYHNTAYTDIEKWYDSLEIELLTTDKITHTKENFNIATEGTVELCSGTAECERNFVFICKEDQLYHVRVFNIGYDTTPIIIQEAYFSPARLTNPLDLTTTLYIQTDDEARCYFNTSHENISEEYFAIREGWIPQTDDVELYNSFLQKRLGTYPKYLANASAVTNRYISYSPVYDIFCEDAAGYNTTVRRQIEISPQNQVQIFFQTAIEQSTRSFKLNFTTDRVANCSYSIDEQPFRNGPLLPSKEHIIPVSVASDGKHTFEIICQDDKSIGVTNPTITVDSTGPTMMDILTSGNTCGLTSMDVKLFSNATIIGADYYNYSITNSTGGFVVKWKQISAAKTATSVTEFFKVQEGENYKFQAQVIDNFGRASTVMVKNVKGTDETVAGCDKNSPIASLRLEKVFGGVDLYVSCSDKEQSCADKYDYAYIESRDQDICKEANNYQSYTYEKIPQTEDQTGTSCVIVYDIAGNNGTASKDYYIDRRCTNGIKDPLEEGIDCGGVCESVCGACGNGKLDAGEDGIDCGGICEKGCFSSSLCGNGKINLGEECDGSTTTTCEDFGFIAGTTSCNKDCTINTKTCVLTDATCGNNILEPGEECDGNKGLLSCSQLGLLNGTTSCNNDCTIDINECEGVTAGECGNVILNKGESCEENAFDIKCELFGLRSGTIECSSCQIDTSSCLLEGSCGDGKIDQGETCEGRNWGNITSCSDLTTKFGNGELSCNPKTCHFDTNACIIATSKETIISECETNTDCAEGEYCLSKMCILSSTDNDPEKDGVKKGLLFPGLAMILGSGGYLVYTTFINPAAPLPSMPGSGMPGSNSPNAPPQPQISPEEAERRRKQMLAELKRKEALQQVAKSKSQAEKELKRESLLSQFKNDKLAEKGAQVAETKAIPKKESVKTPIKTEVQKTKIIPATTAVPSTKTVTPAKKFTSLDELAEGNTKNSLDELTKLSGMPKTSNEAIQRLAALSGKEHAHIRKIINNNPTGKQIAALFLEAEKKHVLPKHLTPLFQHLIDKGKISHATAKNAVHHLATQAKITETQKQKILKDLEALKDM